MPTLAVCVLVATVLSCRASLANSRIALTKPASRRDTCKFLRPGFFLPPPAPLSVLVPHHDLSAHAEEHAEAHLASLAPKATRKLPSMAWASNGTTATTNARTLLVTWNKQNPCTCGRTKDLLNLNKAHPCGHNRISVSCDDKSSSSFTTFASAWLHRDFSSGLLIRHPWPPNI